MPPPPEPKLAVAPRGLSRILLSLIVLCCAISCSCTHEQLDRDDVVGVFFPSFKHLAGLQASWDAGNIDGALHLTTDDVYQAPVYHPPDARKSAGNVVLWSEFELWRPPGTDGVLREASFNTTFTMSANRSHDGDDGGLMFEILPQPFTGLDRALYFPFAGASNYLSDGRRVAVEIGRIDYYYRQGDTGLYVSIAPAPNATSAKYTVWIDYNAVVHNLSVYAVEDGKPKPGQATLQAPVNISDIVSYRWGGLHFGLFASKNRLLPSCQAVVYSWNVTVDRLPDEIPVRRRRRRWLAVLLPSLLVVVIAVMVFVAACYFASRYRALKMKLKLSEALRQLPGVPREFKHAAIRKATHGRAHGRASGTLAQGLESARASLHGASPNRPIAQLCTTVPMIHSAYFSHPMHWTSPATILYHLLHHKHHWLVMVTTREREYNIKDSNLEVQGLAEEVTS